MSDITVPSWRARPENPGPNWRMLAVAGGLLGTAALAGAITWGFSHTGPHTVPLIEPDARPVKIRPEVPGGMVVPNQDQLVLEPPAIRRAMQRDSGINAQLSRGPEKPALEELRLQAAPPAPVQAEAPAAAMPPSALVAPEVPAPVAPPQVSQAAPPQASQTAIATPAPEPATPPAIPPVAAVARPPQPVANGRAMIQLGALNSEDAARGEWERLQRRVPELAGFHPRITRLERDGLPTLYRLRTGGLPDTDAAKALCEAVRARSGQCVPVAG